MILVMAVIILGLLITAPASAFAQMPTDLEDECSPAVWWPKAHGAHLHHQRRWEIERYGQQSAISVAQALQAQVQNGEAVELTIWNHHFEPITDENGIKVPTAILSSS